MKRTVCIYHSIDLDGWMSAAIVKQWFLSETDGIYPVKDTEVSIDENIVTKTINGQDYSIEFIGWNYGDSIVEVLDYDRVIMCDISFSTEQMLAINVNFGTDFIWIDHHQRTVDEVNLSIKSLGIPMEGLITVPGELKAACELTWEYFFPNNEMPYIVHLLGRYDCFGHKGTKEEERVLKFQYGARAFIDGYEKAYEYLMRSRVEDVVSTIYSKGAAIYRYLCIEAQQTYKKSFPVVFDYPSDTGMTTVNFLCVNRERFNPINFGIDYHKNGADGFACFHFVNGKWAFSLYNDNGRIDCSAIANKYGGGGHKGAAGFVWEGDIKKIIGRD